MSWRRTAGVVATTLLLVAAACSSGDGDSDNGSGDTGSGDSGAEESDRSVEGDDGDEAPGGMRFTEVTAEAGLDRPHTELDIQGENAMTSGAAVADVDGDGHLDIFLTRVGAPNSLYLNDGEGRFTDVAAEAGVAGPSDRFGSSAAAFADIDGDGDLDLFVTGYGGGDNELFINDGDGTFTEAASERGLVWPPLPEDQPNHSYGTSFADVNGDGHMDLLVLHWYTPIHAGELADAVVERWFGDDGEPLEPGRPTPCDAAEVMRDTDFPTAPDAPATRSALFINDGTGSFVEASVEWGLPLGEIVAFTGSFGDIDGDGWPDLAITGDGCTSRLFRNDGGRGFVDITDAAGVATDENGMGSVLADITGDGRPDWFVTSISHPAGDDGICIRQTFFFGCSGNRLYANDGDGTFTDATDDYGLRDGGWGWGAVVEDFDNDGTVEIAMNNGYSTGDEPSGSAGDAADAGGGEVGGADDEDGATDRVDFSVDSTRFWVLDPDTGTYRDAAAAIGIDDTTIGHALIAFDMDSDGDLDLLSVPTREAPRLWRNDTTNTNTWITVALDDPTHPGNPWGDGARIDITPTPGAEPIPRWITTTGSYESQKPPTAHIGLGDHTGPIHRIDVHWPHPTPTTQTLTEVQPDQILRVTRE